MLKKVWVYCCTVLLLSTVQAQLYPFTLFNTQNGLVNNRCGNITQDSAGYIWIGTDNGICNYDGRKFNFFPGYFNTYYFAHSQPNMYKGQCLLGASNGGFAVCAGNNVKFMVPSAKNNGHIISTLALDDSTYLVARTGPFDKLLLLQGKTEKEIAVPEIIVEKKTGFLLLLQDAEKNIWVTSNTGVMVFIKGDLNKPYVLPSLINKYNNCIKEDFDHNIFISSAGGIYKIPREQLKDIEQAKPALFYQASEHIPSLGFLYNGDILLGQMTKGVKIFSKALQWKKDITAVNGLSNTVWDIFTDRERNTWFATENGLFRLRDFDFIYFMAQANSSTNIISGALYNNYFLFSNGKDIVKLENDKEAILHELRPNPGDLLGRMLITPDHQLWINSFSYATLGDMYSTIHEYIISNNTLIKKEKVQAKFHLPSAVNLQQAVNISSTSMFFLTQDGRPWLYTKDKVLPVLTDSLTVPPVFSLLGNGAAENELWLINTEKGLYHCKIVQQDGAVRLVLLQAISLPAAVLARCKKILFTREGILLIGTSNRGILVYTASGLQNFVYTKQITTPAISSVLITDMLQDQQGNVWTGTNNGIDRISFTAGGNYSILKGQFDNTLTGRMIYFLKENNDRLYIGTTGSMAIVNIGSSNKAVPPIVHINHITVNNINRDSLLYRYCIFEPDENNISFEFVSPSFINEKQTAYQYKLVGADTSWSSISPNFTITYNQLKPGNYTFRVRAKNADNAWSEKDAVFSFSIKKPFYKHWAFYLLCLGICCGFIYWLYRQRIAGILAVEKTRQRISKDLHDDIGSTLSSITLMNAVLKNKIEKKPDEATQLAEKIEDTSRQMIQNMSDIVWSINPGNDTMDKMQNRLQQFCADVFEDTETRHKLTISEALLKQSLPMELRRDVYMICKELTNNAAKYSKANNYTLMLFLDKKNIGIVAIDDGIGFDNNLIKKGNGINNIQQRVAANNGTVNMNTANGTKWTISIPIH